MKKNETSPDIFLSVVIPYYNSEQYLMPCLKSLIKQKARNIEYIFINDGSTDESHNLIATMQKIDSRIININCIHKGVAAARNTGLTHCRGEYICFLDSDDYILGDGIDWLVSKLVDTRPDLLIHSAKLKGFLNKSWLKQPIQTQSNKLDIFNVNMAFEISGFIPFLWIHAIKSTIIRDNKLFFNENLKIGEDQDFIFKYLFYITNVQIFEKKTLVHRIRRNSIMSSIIKNDTQYIKEQLKMIFSVYKLFADNNSKSKQFNRWVFDSIYWSCQKNSKKYSNVAKYAIIRCVDISLLDPERKALYDKMSFNK